MEVPEYLFVHNDTSAGDSALFNDECPFGDRCMKLRIGVGSNAIDFESDPSRPIFYRMVLKGGRGWSIFELSDNPDDLLNARILLPVLGSLGTNDIDNHEGQSQL